MIQHINGEPGILNPMFSTDAYAVEVESYIYETLIDLDNETLEYKPMLSERWDVSKDHLQYTFYLRKDVKWQDGVPFTADDVIYSYNKMKDPKVDAAVARTILRDVEKVEALSEYIVRFTYSKPYFRALFVCGRLPIVPKHIFDNGMDFNSHPANRAPVGTGPFVFKEWKTKQKIVLEKNPNYWRKSPEIKGIVFRIIEDSIVPFQELKKGEIDLAEMNTLKWEKGTDTEVFRKNFNKVKYYLPTYAYIGWNLRRPFFSDRRVRHAMSMLINKKDMIDKLFFGLPIMVEGDQYIFSDAYDQSIKPDPYDPVKASILLDESGWMDHDGDGIRDKDGVPFKFDFYYVSASSFIGRLATMMREDLKKVGVMMELRGLEFNALARVLSEHTFDAYSLSWVVPLENDPYQVWHSSQIEEGSNYIAFSNAEADGIIEEIRVEFDRGRRNELFKKLQRILHDEQPYTFLFNPASMVAYNKRFGNVKVYKLGIDVKEWTLNP